MKPGHEETKEPSLTGIQDGTARILALTLVRGISKPTATRTPEEDMDVTAPTAGDAGATVIQETIGCQLQGGVVLLAALHHPAPSDSDEIDSS